MDPMNQERQLHSAGIGMFVGGRPIVPGNPYLNGRLNQPEPVGCKVPSEAVSEVGGLSVAGLLIPCLSKERNLRPPVRYEVSLCRRRAASCDADPQTQRKYPSRATPEPG